MQTHTHTHTHRHTDRLQYPRYAAKYSEVNEIKLNKMTHIAMNEYYYHEHFEVGVIVGNFCVFNPKKDI